MKAAAVATVALLVLAVPADAGGPSLLTRVKRLERRVGALAVKVAIPPKTASIHTVERGFVIGPGETRSAVAFCDTGFATGGGAEFNANLPGDRITSSRPEDSNGWYATGVRGTDAANGVLVESFVVYAVCETP